MISSQRPWPLDHEAGRFEESKSNWNNNIIELGAKFFLAGMSAQRDEAGGRTLLNGKTGGRPIKCHCAADLISTGLPCAIHICNWPRVYAIPSWRKTPLAPGHPDLDRWRYSGNVFTVPCLGRRDVFCTYKLVRLEILDCFDILKTIICVSAS